MNKLAINGGVQAITTPLKSYRTIEQEEQEAACEVLETGVLSSFIAGPGPENLGGRYVREFEKNWEESFGVEHAITVNSWTSGLVCCLGASEIEPFDEVITTPWTMCATATSILHWNAIPIFADIDPYTFTVDPVSVESLITDKTSAILAVDIFGRECNIPELRKLSDKYGLKLITDTAQAPLVKSEYGNRFVGTSSDVGGYSLNYHKHFHTGEGGVVITNDNRIAEIVRGIRNHGEADSKLLKSGYKNLLGHNFRLGEIESAIGISQLRKGQQLVKRRQEIALELIEFFEQFLGLIVPLEKTKIANHGFYVFPLILDTDIIKVPRRKIVAALEAEGVLGFMNGYINLSEWEFFRDKIGYGSQSFPWSFSGREYTYSGDLVPVTTKLHGEQFLGFEMCLYELDRKDLELLKSAFEKVWLNLNEL